MFARLRPGEDSQIIFAFGSHGYNNQGKLWLWPKGLDHSLVSVDQIMTLIREECPCNFLFLIHCCHAGAINLKGRVSDPAAPQNEVVLACSSQEYSFGNTDQHIASMLSYLAEIMRDLAAKDGGFTASVLTSTIATWDAAELYDEAHLNQMYGNTKRPPKLYTTRPLAYQLNQARPAIVFHPCIYAFWNKMDEFLAGEAKKTKRNATQVWVIIADLHSYAEGAEDTDAEGVIFFCEETETTVKEMLSIYVKALKTEGTKIERSSICLKHDQRFPDKHTKLDALTRTPHGNIVLEVFRTAERAWKY